MSEFKFVRNLSRYDIAPTGIKAVALVVVYIMTTVLSAGVIVGWGQIYPVLLDTGVFHNLCKESETECAAQEAALDRMFNVGASISVLVQAFAGVSLDFFGPKITSWFGIVTMVVGCLLFGYATPEFETHFIGFQLLSAGGPFIFVSMMPVAALFPNSSGIVLMALNGSFGGGALIFYLFNKVYYAYDMELKYLFVFYALVMWVIFLATILFWPWKKFRLDQEPAKIDTLSDYLSSIKSNMTNIHYLYIVIMVPVLIMKSNFFLGTSYQQLRDILHDKTLVDQYNSYFGIMLPVIGLVVGPIGVIIDKAGINIGILFLLILSTLSSICSIITNPAVLWVRFSIFSIYYPYIYGIWSDFISKNFGWESYGTLYAGVAFMACLVNLLGTLLANYAVKGDKFVSINIMLMVGTSVLCLYPIIMGIKNLSRLPKKFERINS
eukprot:TRINITY_DN10141_c0_g1_i1.p1 TRINITY_DN10141_c0_g1~~TRINITY_DN10141_c0_g1_i1.p1  ORF type:complete len:437 (-),score=55.67 TRINITY_DN10141_c0_g1_i1:23-1333(-)